MSLFENFQQPPAQNSSTDASRDNPAREKNAIFIDYIKLQAYEDGYIDRTEERKLLEYAIEHGIEMDQALSIIHNLAQQQGYVIEREVENQAKELLAKFSISGGVIDKKEFNEAARIFTSACKGKLSDSEARRRLKKIVLENHWKVKEGGLFSSNWFTEIS